MFDLAIIGAGATAVSLLKQIQDEVYAAGLPSPMVALFGQVKNFARGEAFGDAAPIHKVNTPPHMLCISEIEPGGFARWMVAKDSVLELYPSRLTYSQFLRETYKVFLTQAF